MAISDTHPDMARKQIELLRAAGPERRAQLAMQLTWQSRWRAMRAIERAHPELSEQDRKLLFVRVHYGNELADRVRTYLKRRAA